MVRKCELSHFVKLIQEKGKNMAKKYIEYEKGKQVELGKDDAPELTEHFFKNAKNFKEVLPELHTSWKRSRGRPKLAHPKREIKIRVDHDVLESFKAQGKGWQTKMNQVLSEWAKKHGML